MVFVAFQTFVSPSLWIDDNFPTLCNESRKFLTCREVPSNLSLYSLPSKHLSRYNP